METTSWISRGFEELLHDLRGGARKKKPSSAAEPFDVVIVGSGYGGAVAAAGLAGCRKDGGEISVCVLERGKEYLRGMFPSRMAELAGHVRFSTPGAARPRGTREGLFDFRIGDDVCALLANGLGGGSLINAGVMEVPEDAIFGADPERWPPAFRQRAQRLPIYARAKALLGAADDAGGDNTILLQLPQAPPAKYQALRDLAGGHTFRPAAITVAMAARTNRFDVRLEKCIRCGDCATGCNHGAKESLDLNLLAQARRDGAEIYTGATVLRLEQDAAEAGVWLLTVVHTDEKLRAREAAPLRLRARQVILAAGAFGSTEILLRSQSDALRFSPRLGQGFSTNGDMLAAAYDQGVAVNAVARESDLPNGRNVGPTITGIVDLPRQGGGRHVVEEMAIPGPLRRAFEEAVTTASTLHGLANPDEERHDPAAPLPQFDPCGVDPRKIGRSSILAVMGRDDLSGGGSLELNGGAHEDDGDGAVRVRWPALRTAPLFREQIDALEAQARSTTGGTILPNPLWQLLPDAMQFLLDNERGPLLTVHPLGGCAMGADASTGVVDYSGRVFKAAPATAKAAPPTYPGLAVLDGAIVPAALGTNPALTIAALALTAIEELSEQWDPQQSPGARLDPRPVFRTPPVVQEPRPTQLEFRERMSGKARLTNRAGAELDCVIELTLPFEACAVEDLLRPQSGGNDTLRRRLEVLGEEARHGELRVFRDCDEWRNWKRAGEPDDPAMIGGFLLARARVGGELYFMHRDRTTYRQRWHRALLAWLLNRGLRDIWQWLAERWRHNGLRGFFGAPLAPSRGARQADDPKAESLAGDALLRWRQAKALASHAGEVRLFDYELTLGGVQDAAGFLDDAKKSGPGKPCILGRKRLTYARRSNPWRQLMQMTLSAFPGLAPGVQPVLELDAKYLAREHMPLFRVVGQENQPSALADLASLGAYFLRVLLSIHVWSFRRPDAPAPRAPQRLPGAVDGLPAPEIKELEVDRLADGTPVNVRLTRYRRPRAEGRPVVMIHGYSASGTTFAHPAVRPGLAQHFCDAGRDVWILDLRTSSGMPTARQPWAFEDAALEDLPAAFAHICGETRRRVDVVAHCMGAAMLSMAVLKPPAPGDKYHRERQRLHRWIRRAVLSQVGPVLVMSPANIFRGYAMSYLRYYLPLAGYDFRVKDDPGLIDQLLDRALATLPYPEAEFDVENPLWPCRRTPFAGTRHRMDAIYGRDFSLATQRDGQLLDDEVLESIDDLFGPLSLDTVAQGIHFARLQVIATRAGRNEFVQPDNFARWRFPTLSLHGEDNGLFDVATLARIERIMNDGTAGKFRTRAFEGFGHQDSLIGRRAPEVFEAAAQYLEERAR